MRRFATAATAGLAGLIFSTAPAIAAAPVEGRWSMGGGVVELRSNGDGYESHWIQQRPDILCPEIDDQDGDLQLRGRGDTYRGTWNWVLKRDDGRCESVGLGPVTITVAADRRTARLVGEAPKGYTEEEAHTLRRVPAELVQPSLDDLAAVPDLVTPLELGPPALNAVQLAAVPRLQQLPFQGREPFVK
jgi:hypothetical protein